MATAGETTSASSKKKSMSEKAKTQITLAAISGLVSVVVAVLGTFVSLRSAGSQISHLDERAKDLKHSIDYIATPPGTIAAYGGPLNTDELKKQGWLLCNGDPVSRVEFKSLFDQIGDSWGRGDGVHTFNLPDLRGVFLRGVNHGRTDMYADCEATNRLRLAVGGNKGDQVGSYQSDNLPTHSHQWGEFVKPGHLKSWDGTFKDVSALVDGAAKQIPVGIASKDDDYMDVVDVPGGFWTKLEAPKRETSGKIPKTDTRPRNAYVNFIIKY